MIGFNVMAGQSDTNELSDVRDNPRMPLRHSQYAAAPPRRTPWRLLLQVTGDTQDTIGLDLRDKILMGRADVDATVHPDVDLMPFGGASLGVSRRHAQIIFKDQSLFIEDLNSTNQTQLNGFMLRPGHRYRLKDGDELRLGKVRIVLRFVKAPSD